MESNTAIIIPIRMNSTRLPGKFHADIAGKPMILHVLDRAKETGIKNIYVAGDHVDHQKIVEAYGQRFIMTDLNHQSGSDRSFEALNIIEAQEKKKFEYIINLQGDAPYVEANSILASLKLLEDSDVDIGTIAALIEDPLLVNNPNVVKIATNQNNKALYFSRAAIPYGQREYYYHIGVYAYKREALKKFVSWPHSKLESVEKLEQLRALENGLQINVAIVDEIPITVDVEEDLIKARSYHAAWLRLNKV
jgi:3-deoxy-manno-octulosonate cytidylyltransferase (CMP-KDO synthetase)